MVAVLGEEAGARLLMSDDGTLASDPADRSILGEDHAERIPRIRNLREFLLQERHSLSKACAAKSGGTTEPNDRVMPAGDDSASMSGGSGNSSSGDARSRLPNRTSDDGVN